MTGDSATLVERIPLAIASVIQGGEVLSEDGRARIKIDSGGVYSPIELRIRRNAVRRSPRQKGNAYSFEPKDVPLAGYARISLSYEGRDCDPRRLGL